MKKMTPRALVHAILHYQPYERMPIVHFGFWNETLKKWADEGHLTQREAAEWGDGNPTDAMISRKLGFDFSWATHFGPNSHLFPGFDFQVVRTLADGSRHVMNSEGVIELEVAGAVSIRAEIEHTLKDRKSWEEHYLPRYQWDSRRVSEAWVRCDDVMKRWDQGGLEFLRADQRDYNYGIFCGSLYGYFRNIVGAEGSAYLLMDDEPLFDEILATIANLSFRSVKYALEAGGKFDSGHFWEDICFKNGPLVAPSVFDEKVGPYYRRVTDLLKQYGIDIVSLDCDGCIDALIPTWVKNGVNTMFPIEVGTWNASITPWREKYGRDLRGVGGMNKVVFGYDKAAIDAEVVRLRKLVDIGGYIPCPDHRIAPEAKWELVQYYCDQMRRAFA